MFKVTVAIIIKKLVIVKNKNLQYQVKKLFCVLTVIIFD